MYIYLKDGISIKNDSGLHGDFPDFSDTSSESVRLFFKFKLSTNSYIVKDLFNLLTTLKQLVDFTRMVEFH